MLDLAGCLPENVRIKKMNLLVANNPTLSLTCVIRAENTAEFTQSPSLLLLDNIGETSSPPAPGWRSGISNWERFCLGRAIRIILFSLNSGCGEEPIHPKLDRHQYYLGRSPDHDLFESADDPADQGGTGIHRIHAKSITFF